MNCSKCGKEFEGTGEVCENCEKTSTGKRKLSGGKIIGISVAVLIALVILSFGYRQITAVSTPINATKTYFKAMATANPDLMEKCYPNYFTNGDNYLSLTNDKKKSLERINYYADDYGSGWLSKIEYKVEYKDSFRMYDWYYTDGYTYVTASIGEEQIGVFRLERNSTGWQIDESH